MRDMVPHNNRSIRNIAVPPNHQHSPVDENAPIPRRRRRFRGWILAVVVLIILCAAGGFLLSTLFAGTSVTLYPKTQTITASSTIISEVTPSTGELPYITMSITRSATTTVAANGTQKVSRAASGAMIIFNTYSTASQRLIANTRFEAPDGKIYRIHDSVVVPGAKKQASGALTPGSISATLYADSPGAEYNRGSTRLTIPGFKGDPKYNGFYGQVDSVSNGFVGTEPAVAAAELTKAQTSLAQALRDSITAAVAGQVPPDVVALPTTLDIILSPVSQTVGSSNSANISQSATGIIAAVRVNDLATILASKNVSGYKGEPVSIVDPKQVVIQTNTTKPVGPLTLHVSGSIGLVWQYDLGAIKTALIGKPKSSFESIIGSFAPAITKAQAKFRPFWMSTFPSQAEKITVEAAPAAAN